MVEYYPQWLAGQDITADQLNEMIPKVIRKTTDTARTSTTTTTADPELSLTLAANAVYVWDGWVKYSADPAVDMTVDFTVPSGALGEWAAHGAGSGTAGVTTAGYLIRTESNDVAQARNYYGLNAGDSQPLTVFLYGTIRTSSGGTFSLDWAQGSSGASATTVYTDSWLRFQRIA